MVCYIVFLYKISRRVKKRLVVILVDRRKREVMVVLFGNFINDVFSIKRRFRSFRVFFFL